ncbi:MAG: HD domain-containing protein, partial [Bacilli bacterium]|nr:HD domain-containing protein [Bacilli bacterium]
IKDKNNKEDIEYLINLLPEYFFKIPASSTGKYHPKFASTEHGLVKHTKVAVRIAFDLFQLNDTFTDKEKDLIIMALIMHDGLKKGLVEVEYTRFDHPLLVSKLIMEHSKELKMNIDDVRLFCRMIESHMGKWNTNKYSKVVLPIPSDKYERYVHMCDYLASRSYLNVKFNKLNIV